MDTSEIEANTVTKLESSQTSESDKKQSEESVTTYSKAENLENSETIKKDVENET